jgi:hypothetical protein
MFDSCLLLSSNGYVVYMGPQHLATPFMSFLGFRQPPGENEADFLMDVISGTPAVLRECQHAVTTLCGVCSAC